MYSNGFSLLAKILPILGICVFGSYDYPGSSGQHDGPLVCDTACAYHSIHMLNNIWIIYVRFVDKVLEACCVQEQQLLFYGKILCAQ